LKLAHPIKNFVTFMLTPELEISKEPKEPSTRAQANFPAQRARLVAYYLSRDRVLSLFAPEKIPTFLLSALQGQNVAMSSAILSNAVGAHVIEAIRTGGVQTLTQLVFEGNLKPGAAFIYDGHVYGKGFAHTNKSPLRSLSEKLDAPLSGRKLVVEFSRNGLVNDTASSRLSGSVANIFIYGHVTSAVGETIRAVPYIIGDLADAISPLSLPLVPSLELRPEEIAQLAAAKTDWMPTKTEFERMRQVPEQAVKELICRLLGEYSVPSDWGGEESDVLSANLLIDGSRYTGAFLLKGPARFHPMRPTDLGKNGDQLYRLFNIPAQVYVVQHCHSIGAAVRKQAEAFALSRSFVAPCRLVFIDGLTTARLLRAHGEWPTKFAPRTRKRKT
jgi:hypothetical protein